MSKKKILIIDDESDLTYFMKKHLEATGDYEVITATGGEEGIEAAINHQPSLILLDIVMPEMDGFEVLRRLRKEHPQTRNIPVAINTALKEPEHSAAAEKFGIVDYIIKPFKKEDLVNLVAQKA